MAWELGKRLAEDAIVVSDSGTNTTWWARQIPARRGQMHSVAGTLASMACGLPYAVAAQVAYPERQVVAFVGDAGYSMLMAELATAVKYHLPIKVVIVKNNYLGQIKWEQMAFLGNPEYEVDLQPIDFAMNAESFGARGLRIENPADCGRILVSFGRPYSSLRASARTSIGTQSARLRQALTSHLHLSSWPEIDILNRHVRVGDSKLQLTPLELGLLYPVVANPGRVLTRKEILEKLWGADYGAQTKLVDQHICQLRARLQADARQPRFIVAVAARGYRLLPSG